MKFSKNMSKVFATTLISSMLLVTSISASTVKTPDVGSVSTQYTTMVQAANNFDPTLGAIIVDTFSKNCYTVDAINNAIANANNAISAVNNIVFFKSNNSTLGSGSTSTVGSEDNGNLAISYVRDNGNVAAANSYLQAAQLGGVAFGLTASTTGEAETTAAYPGGVKVPTSEYYNTVTFKTSTSLYASGTTIPVITTSFNNNNKITGITFEKNSLGSIVTKLNNYVSLLNAVKAFDEAAGCYSTGNTTSNTTNTTVVEIKDAVITAKDVTLTVGDDFDIMNGVTAKDNNGTGKDLTSAITTSGEVNTAVAGTYKVTYKVVGENGNTVSETILVTVKEPIADATITAANAVVEVGDKFDPMSIAKATDHDGKDISNLLTVTGTVNTDKVGDYELVYTVVGANGTKVQKNVTVSVVQSKEDAVIFAEDQTIYVGDLFNEMEDVTAYDNGGEGKDLTNKVKVSGYVNTSKEGKYTLTYKVTGANGITVVKKVVITVIKEDSNTTNTTNTTSNTTSNTTCKPVDTTCAPVNTTCAPVNTTCVPVNTTCAPVNTTCVPVNTTCAPVNTTCAPVNTTCAPVNTTSAPNTTCVTGPIVIQVDPIKVQVTKDVTVNVTDTLPANTMKPTGSNMVEIGLSALSMLGAVGAIIKRRR